MNNVIIKSNKVDLIEGVSVIVCSLNRAAIFQNLYKSILADSCVHEFIFINDGSCENYAQVVKEMRMYCEGKDIHFIYLKNEVSQGAPFCRNYGLNYVTSLYVFFIDDDMFLKAGTLAKLHGDIKRLEVQAIGPRVYYLTQEEYSRIDTYSDFTKKHNITKRLIDRKVIIGHFNEMTEPANVFSDFVTSIILYDYRFLNEKNIRFYEGYRGNAFREETDPQIQLVLEGGKIMYCSDCVCFHLPHEILGKSGQRKNGIIWYEYWAIKNNFVFLRRFKNYFEEKYRLPLVLFQINFILWRVSFYVMRIPVKIMEIVKKRWFLIFLEL